MSATNAVTVTTDSIDVGKLRAELDEINRSILALLEKGKSIIDDAAASITQESFDAGRLLVYRAEVPPTAGADGIMQPAQPAHWDLLTAGEFASIRDRLALLGKLVNLLDKPIGGAPLSYAQQIRENGPRWKVV